MRGGAPAPLPPLLRAFLVAGLAALALAAVSIGARVVVPVVEALIVCFVLNAGAGAIRRLPGVGRRLPRPLALLMVAAVAFAVGFWVVQTALRELAAIGPQLARAQEALGPLLERAIGLSRSRCSSGARSGGLPACSGRCR